jgi:hypothetical protein
VSTVRADSGDKPDVRITNAVADELEKLPHTQAHSVQQVIDTIGETDGEPFDLPGAPPGTQYLARVPAARGAPAVIYRPMLPAEDGDWLVTSLAPRGQYNAWRKALVDALPTAGGVAVGAVVGAVIHALTRGRQG